MAEQEFARRDVLRRAAGLTALAGLTGCLQGGVPNRDGTGTAGDEVTTTAGQTATPGPGGGFAFADWIPEPSTVSSGGDFGFGVLRPAALAPHTEALGASYYAELVAVHGLLEQTGIAAETVTSHVAFGAGSAVAVSFDADAAATALEEGGYESDGSHGGFDLWTPTEEADRDGLVVALGDGVLVVGRTVGETSARSAATTIVDAGTGNEKRLVGTDEGADAIADRIAGGDLAVGITREAPSETEAEYGRFAGNTAFGYDLAVDGDETTLTIHHVFASEDDVDVEAVRTWLDGAGTGSVLAQLEDRTVEADGAATVTSGTLATERISESTLGGLFVSSGEEVEENVQAGASVAVDSDADTVKVTWTSNQNADHLRVTFTPSDGGAVEKTLESVGNSTTYEGTDGTSVHVTVTGVAGDTSTVVLDRSADL